jgi:hypothetical protein
MLAASYTFMTDTLQELPANPSAGHDSRDQLQLLAISYQLNVPALSYRHLPGGRSAGSCPP